MKRLQYPIYKGTGGSFGAIQFNFQGPHYYNHKEKRKDFTGSEALEVVDGRKILKDGWKEREGCTFVEIAPTVDKNKYDWKQKIIFALSVNDMGKFLYFLTTGQSSVKKDRERDGKPTYSFSIMHDPHAKSDKQGQIQKYFRMYSPGGPAEGGKISIFQKNGDQKLSHEVPISGDEVMTLRALLQAAIPSALNW